MACSAPLRGLVLAQTCVLLAAVGARVDAQSYPPISLTISNFESDVEWNRGTLTASPRQQGDTSLQWIPFDGALSLTHDFDVSAYDGLRLWVHSNKDTGHELLFYLSSENAATSGGDYYNLKLQVDWTGWKLVELPFLDFKSNREPLGYDAIDSIRIYASGWDMTPDPEVVLYLDTLEAYGFAYPPRTTDPEVTVFDWRVGAVRAAFWTNALENDFPGQQFPSAIDVVDWPPYSLDSKVVRYSVNCGEDLSAFPEASELTNKRAESHSNSGVYGAVPGDTVWWRFTYRWEKLDRDHEMTIFQWRNQNDGVLGGPGVELQFKPVGEQLQILGTGWAVDYPDRGVLVEDTVADRWYDFICTITYSVSDGAARCWVDGRLKWDYTGPTMQNADYDTPHIRNGLYRWGAAYDYPASGFDTETGLMVAYQGLTAFAVNPDDGFRKMLDAFPSTIHVDTFESGDARLWSAQSP
jgi:hypothetical protein